MSDREPLLFAFESGVPFARRAAERLGVELGELEERHFEDGEHKTRPMCSVRGRDVYVIQSLHGDASQSPNDRLCRLLFLIGALKDCAARRVTAITPYLCYSRKDRRSQPRDPVTTRYVAAMFEAVRVDRAVTVDVHNIAAFQNAFRCVTEHLEAKPLLVDYFESVIGDEDVVVVSPDAGGTKRAERFRTALGARLSRRIPSAFVEKYRQLGKVTGDAIVGDVEGRVAIILDDLISTGGTMRRAAVSLKAVGAQRVYAAATHGLFTGNAEELIHDEAIERIVVTNTVPLHRVDLETASQRIEVLDCAPLVAEAIRRLHDESSISDLFET